MSTAFLIGLAFCGIASADINTTGDVTPDPATTTANDDLYVGYTADGSMTIDLASGVINDRGYLGYDTGVTGTATVTGAGSTWNSSYLNVGYSGSGTLNITDGGAVSSADASIGNGTVTVTGPGSTWTNTGTLDVGGSNGTLNITNGGAVSNGQLAYIGIGFSSTGTVTVDGTGSTWNSGRLFVGGSNGTLNITNGGAVSNDIAYVGLTSVSMATVTVNGSGSTWTNTDDLNVSGGTLNITDGGAVTTGGSTSVTYYPSSSSGTINFDNGTLTTSALIAAGAGLTGTGTINATSLISDVDLVFDSTHGLIQNFIINDSVTVNLDVDGSGYLGLGHSGVGTMSISDNVDVTSTYGILGYEPGSNGTATVTGAGSTWIITGGITVGEYGTGTLNITNGGAVSNGGGGANSYIGMWSGSMGTVTVDGTGSTWNSGRLFVGGSTGTLNITGGGAVSNTSGHIGAFSGSTRTVTVDGTGSTWTNSSSLYVGYYGTGTLNIQNGGAVSNTEGSISYGSTVTVDGAGSTWTNTTDLYVGYYGSGTLNIQNGGAVTVGGELSINSPSTLDIILASLGDPLLDVAGDANLDGTLSVAVDGGLVLDQGDVFTLIDVGTSIIGTFIGLAQGDSVGNFGGIDLFISYVGGDGNDVTLVVPLPGDVDLDGFVDGDDLSTIISYWGQSLGRKFGDLNSNGIVDGPDYAEVLSYWNPPPEPPSQATPEPATLALLLIGALALLRRRK